MTHCRRTAVRITLLAVALGLLDWSATIKKSAWPRQLLRKLRGLLGGAAMILAMGYKGGVSVSGCRLILA
jgi:hypothetical protein